MTVTPERCTEYYDVTLVALHVFHVLDEEANILSIFRPFALLLIGSEEFRIVDRAPFNRVLD